jgi:hypothetical protein
MTDELRSVQREDEGEVLAFPRDDALHMIDRLAPGHTLCGELTSPPIPAAPSPSPSMSMATPAGPAPSGCAPSWGLLATGRSTPAAEPLVGSVASGAPSQTCSTMPHHG